jgi:hypothetical protein
LRPIGFGQDTLDHQGVDVDKADLQQVKGLGPNGTGRRITPTCCGPHFFQKLPDNPPLHLWKFEKALQDSLFFNRRYRELERRI